jgi:hypothetical protein
MLIPSLKPMKKKLVMMLSMDTLKISTMRGRRIAKVIPSRGDPR